MIEHQVELLDVYAHLFRVTLTISNPAKQQMISLPVWIPGSYLVREFSGKVERLVATQNGKRLMITQRNKNTWLLHTQANQLVVVSYVVYAFDASVRTAFLDSQRGFFNGTSLFMRVFGQEHQPQGVLLVSPVHEACQAWQVATALVKDQVDQAGWGCYVAQSYDELVDSPVELGVFWRGGFTVRGVAHTLVISGAPCGFDGRQLLADTQKIVSAVIAFWHGKRVQPPASLRAKGYVFLLHLTHAGYGGLEHMHSTALIAKRHDVMPNSEGYVRLLGLICHEYFHTWNVKRLRPLSLKNYDYDRENYTDLLWFFEGFTSYYDDLLLCRAGLITHQQYLDLVATTLMQVQQTPGRRVHSLADSSFEAWTKYYRVDENSINSTVSYYAKGALVALCLDLRLRQKGFDLDAVMRQLWQKHVVVNSGEVAGITEEDILQAIPDMPCRQSLKKWTHGTQDLPIASYLSGVGIRMQVRSATWVQQLGVHLYPEVNGVGVRIKQVLTGGWAHHAGFAAGDEWLAVSVNQQIWRITKVDEVLLYAAKGASIDAWVVRDQRILQLAVKLPAQTYLSGAPGGDIKLVIADLKKLLVWLG